MKFYLRPEFKILNRKWREILENSGFQDHENYKNRLKYPDVRTIGFENRDLISSFYSCLGEFLGGEDPIPLRDRDILERYHKGEWIVKIAARLDLSPSTVRAIILKYKKQLMRAYFR